MTSQTKKSILVCAIIALIVLLDQSLKIFIHSYFDLYQSVEITPWFVLCYVENNGMAFGVEWFSKLALTLFRIIAVGALGWYIHSLIKHNWRTSYLVMLALITAGAVGNIIDCMFYGIIWDYAPFMYGKVIDMLYFPLIHNGAGEVIFFRPVFNIADTAITTAIFIVLLFFRHDFNNSFEAIKTPPTESVQDQQEQTTDALEQQHEEQNDEKQQDEEQNDEMQQDE